MTDSIWIIVKKQTRFLRVKAVEWYIAHTAGVYTDAKPAREMAKFYSEGSVGWTFRAVRYNRAR
jgi:hypothetical protein